LLELPESFQESALQRCTFILWLNGLRIGIAGVAVDKGESGVTSNFPRLAKD
jgi:hypothetical protein